MHIHSLDKWRHSHDFHIDSSSGERRTLYVVLLTALMMVIEVAAGYHYGSMALLADGWHMGTHVAALGISLFAYSYARRHAANPSFSFGTGKVSSLGGFASAIALAVVALLMGLESTERLLLPQSIRFDEAIVVAVIGLIVNLVSAWMLQGSHSHDHDHGHQHDHNLRAAYLHVIADALTSVFAIVALLCGKVFGLIWMDALMGMVGAIIISKWSLDLIRVTSKVLLDSTPDNKLGYEIKRAIESDSDNRIADLHLWCVGPNRFAAIISLVTHNPQEPEYYKRLLADLDGLSHTTIEVNGCTGDSCISS